MLHRTSCTALTIMTLASLGADAAAQPLAFVGVSLSGAEFGSAKPGATGKAFKDYTYPTDDEVDYFRKAGMNVLRVPFLWERMRPTIDGPIDAEELKRLDHVVNKITSSGGVALIDPHSYARYFGKAIGSPEVPPEALASFWKLMATEFKANDRVWFGLMNEPHDMPDADWLAAANASIESIRKTGAKNLILVPGNNWTGAHSWTHSGNGTSMLDIKDPADHYVFEVHQYFDQDSSGTKPDIVSKTIGSERLSDFTAWCKIHKMKAFLGEFAVANTPDGQAALADVLAHMEANADVWTGFTWWSAGPWWGDYIFSIEPKDNVDAPQMAWLKPHLQKSGT